MVAHEVVHSGWRNGAHRGCNCRDGRKQAFLVEPYAIRAARVLYGRVEPRAADLSSAAVATGYCGALP